MGTKSVGGAYYAVIPAEIRYDRELRPNAKLLYGELTSLCNSSGYCWATNEYFAELFDLSVPTVSRLISQLADKGYIRCEMAATDTGSERRIYAGVFTVQGGIDKNDKTPPGGIDENDKRGLDENVNPQHLRIINNNIPPYSPPKGDRTDKPKRKREPKMVPQYFPERFEQFWQIYPGGGSRARAVAAWDSLKPSDELIDTMALALHRQMKTQQWKEGIGIPHASTWLNQKRWTDKLPPPKKTPPTPPDPGGWVKDPEVM